MERLIQLYEKVQESDVFRPDAWQKKVLECRGNICIRAGRQVGKSATVAKKAAGFALEHDGTTALVIAAAQRQSSYIFEKIMAELNKVHDAMLQEAGGFKDDIRASKHQNMIARREFESEKGLFDGLPTKTEVKLKNGSRIFSLPVGKTGIYIKGLTVDLLIADEAAYIPEICWLAVLPMTAVSKQTRQLGWIILLSTPFGKGGYFYNATLDDDFMQVHQSSERCPRISRDFLRKEKARLTKQEYAQEYLAEFVDDINQFFPTQLIKERMNFIGWSRETDYSALRSYYLGMDIARYGADETAICILEMKSGNKYGQGQGHCRIVKAEVYERLKITETARMAEHLNEKYNFKAVFVDDQGLGAGVLDILREKLGKQRVVGLNNSSKSVDASETKYRRLLKEDLYSNALKMMELGELDIINNLKLLKSLKSMQFEYTCEGNLRIFGSYSHLSEAFVRVCWAKREKKLKLFIA